jgi:Domain of unknown function (DUF1877)
LADADPEELVATFEEGGVDLDKAWQAVGWLLARCGAGQNPLLEGEMPIGEDFGYAPLIYFPPAQVARLSAQMGSVSTALLSNKLDLSVLTTDGIYLALWDQADEAEDLRSWIVEEAERVIALYRSATSDGLGILVWIG